MALLIVCLLPPGCARLAAPATKDHPPIRWVLPPGLSAKALSGVFKLDWISRYVLSKLLKIVFFSLYKQAVNWCVRLRHLL